VELGPVAGTLQDALRHHLTGTSPDPHAVAEYVQNAFEHEKFIRAVRAELLGQRYPVRSARFLMLRQHGLLTAKGWKGVYKLAQAVALPGLPSLDSAATQVGVDPRTLRTYCHRILDMDWRHVRKGFGWKWVVERAMQRFSVGGERDDRTPCAVPTREWERKRFPWEARTSW
jgi:hypothetical protein